MKKCSICQTENDDQAQFCAKCGAQLETAGQIISDQAVVAVGNGQAVVAEKVERIETVNTTSGNTGASNDTDNIIAIITACMLKPATTFREQSSGLSLAKNSCILAAIALVLSLITTLLSSMVSAVVERSCSYLKSTCKLEIDFGNLGHLKYFDIIWQTLVGHAIALVVITGIFFGIAKLFKDRRANFWRTLSIAALAALPLALISLIGTLIFNFIPGIGTILTLIALAVCIIVFFTGIVQSSDLSGDQRVYYLLASIVSTLVIMAILGWLLGDKISFFARFDFLGF